MKYQLTYQLFKEEKDAIDFCNDVNKCYTPYMRKHHPAHYLPHTIKDNDHKGNPWIGFIVWFKF